MLTVNIGISKKFKEFKMKTNIIVVFNTDLKEFKEKYEGYVKDCILQHESTYVNFVSTRSVEECPNFKEISDHYYDKPLGEHMVSEGFYHKTEDHLEMLDILKRVWGNQDKVWDLNSDYECTPIGNY